MADKGVVAHMNLDDLIVVSENLSKAMEQYKIVMELLSEMGLPEAVEKSQPPTRCLKWLGIEIDLV